MDEEAKKLAITSLRMYLDITIRDCLIEEGKKDNTDVSQNRTQDFLYSLNKRLDIEFKKYTQEVLDKILDRLQEEQAKKAKRTNPEVVMEKILK